MKLIRILLIVVVQINFVCACSGQNAIQDSGYFILPQSAKTTVPFELLDNRIFIDVKINNQGPFRFLLDSGAGNLVTPEVAGKLNLKKENSFQTSGVGEKTVEAWDATISQIDIGEVRAINQKFVVLSLEEIRQAIGFKRLDGLVGFQLFNSLIAKIDYERNLLTFTKFSGNSLQDGETAVPFQFNGRIPQIDAEIDGFRGKLKIDTGDRSSLTLYAPFVEKNRLREKYAPKVETITGWGIGGPVRAQVTRAKKISVGKFNVENTVARLPIVKSGAFMDASVMGSVGTGFLKRFTVTFDYSRRQLIFAKNRNFSAPDEYDRAGMWLSQRANVFEVLDVSADSPAAKAGIKIGDKILAVNNQASDKLFLPDVRLMLKRADLNEPVKLSVQTGTFSRDVFIVLKDII